MPPGASAIALSSGWPPILAPGQVPHEGRGRRGGGVLMAIGKKPRRGFALILHDADRPATTLIYDWHPRGLCVSRFSGSSAP
jgi:hypothetical protein